MTKGRYMEQRDLFGDAGSSTKVDGKVKALRFNLADGRALELEARTGRVTDEFGGPTPTERAVCEEIRKDYATAGWSSFRYVIKSAMHKEIRRGDVVAAARWARLFALADGDGKVKQYVKNILFEESRNMTLFATWRSVRGLDGETMARQLAASAKKWELPVRRGLFARYALAYKRALVTGTMDVDAVLDSGDIDQMYELFWRVQIAQNQIKADALDDSLRERLTSMDDPAADLGSNWYKFFYTPKIAMELIAGHWNSDANKLIRDVNTPVRKSDTFEVPYLADYVYDNHTRPGLARYVKHLSAVRPRVPLPPGLDLRWTGMVRGACWREHAFEQFGIEYGARAWHEVDIPAPVWDAVNHADAFFYASLYRRARIGGVPFPRE